MLSLIVY